MLIGLWLGFTNECIEVFDQVGIACDLHCHPYFFYIFMFIQNMFVGAICAVFFSLIRVSFWFEVRVGHWLVFCARPVFRQADYHMRSLPRLAHDGREDLYWARVSLMPCDGHQFVV